MSVGGKTTPGKENGVDDASWVDVNLTDLKMKKIHVTNRWWIFKAMMN
jgi:hypothetical protein